MTPEVCPYPSWGTQGLVSDVVVIALVVLALVLAFLYWWQFSIGILLLAVAMTAIELRDRPDDAV